MSILVVGSVAFDTIATPSGRVKDILGGAATYFCSGRQLLHRSTRGRRGGRRLCARSTKLCSRSAASIPAASSTTKGKTFRWGGQYLDNLNEAKTDFTELNVFEKFQPRIPKEYSDTQFLFLANIHPDSADARCGGRWTACA